jgi:TusA-related sulfurtransferase
MNTQLRFEERLDIRDLDCPMPIMQTKAKLARMVSGDYLQISANDKEFIKEIHALSARDGHKIIEEDIQQELLYFVIEKS